MNENVPATECSVVTESDNNTKVNAHTEDCQCGHEHTNAPAPVEEVKFKAVDPIRRSFPRVGRNEPCPCNSGRKFKRCHGQPVVSLVDTPAVSVPEEVAQ